MRDRIGTEERILFFKRLGLYLQSGMPIRQALQFLQSDIRNAHTKRFIAAAVDAVMHGRPLSFALKQYSDSFSPFYISLIQVGETSGTLASTLSYIATIMRQRSSLRKKIISALIYPAIISIGTIAITLFLVLYAFPKIVPLFKGFHEKLPFTTRVLIGLSNAGEQHGPVIVVSAIIVAISAIGAIRMPTIKWCMHNALLQLPITGKTISFYYTASICRTLATLLESGIPIERSISLVEEGITHMLYRDSLCCIRDAIRSGTPLGKEFRKSKHLYPDTAVQLIIAGEMTGTLTQSLMQVAVLYEEQLSEMVAGITSLIEPALMIGMGLAVGFVAMAIITPLYGLTQNLSIH